MDYGYSISFYFLVNIAFYFSHLRFAKEIRSKIPFLFLLERIMTKQIFTQSQQPEEEEILPKQEFYNVETTIDNEPLEGELLDEQFEQIVKPKASGWKTALKLTALLF